MSGFFKRWAGKKSQQRDEATSDRTLGHAGDDEGTHSDAATPSSGSAAVASEGGHTASGGQDSRSGREQASSTAAGSSDHSGHNERQDTQRSDTPNHDRSTTSEDRESTHSERTDWYQRWHDALQRTAENESVPQAGAQNEHVDLSHPHPTGSAQLYSGIPTRLTSLVREEHALSLARQRLAKLLDRIATVSEKYGSAPVHLAIGRVSWDEANDRVVPQTASVRDDGFIPQAGYDLTGELHVDEVRELLGTDAARVDSDAAHAGSEQRRASDAAVDTVVDADADSAHKDGDTPRGVQVSQTHAVAAPAGATVSKVKRHSEWVLYRAVQLKPTGDGDAFVTLRPHVEINPALLTALREHGLPAHEVARLRTSIANVNQQDAVLAEIRSAGKAYLPGFDFAPRSVIGLFIHPGNVLLEDLEHMKPYVESSGVVAALAGDEQTKSLTSLPLPPADPYDRAPEAERGVGDHDVLELGAIEAVASGRSFVIDTPAGSDALPTEAAIVADAAASGRSVIVVANKASAARALIAELEAEGLGDLVLDFSDIDAVPRRIREGLRLRADQAFPERTLELRSALQNDRTLLESYVNAVHAQSPVWHTSVAELIGHLAHLSAQDDAPSSSVRLSRQVLANVVANREALSSDLHDAYAAGAFRDPALSPWMGAVVTNAEQGEAAVESVQRLREVLPVAMAQMQRSAAQTHVNRARTLNEWLAQIRMFEGLRASLAVFKPEIYDVDPRDLVAATASKESREAAGIDMKNSERRRLQKKAVSYLVDGASRVNIHRDLVQAMNLREEWRKFSDSSGLPKVPDGLEQIKVTAADVLKDLDDLAQALPEQTPRRDMHVEDLLGIVNALGDAAGEMADAPTRNLKLASLSQAGLAGVVEDFKQRGVNADAAEAELDLVITNSIFEQLLADNPVLGALGPADLVNLARRVRNEDLAHTKTLAGPVLAAAIAIMRRTISKHRKETMTLDGQLERYSTGVLREVIGTYPSLVQVARPVWVIPPAMVAQFIPPMPWVDLVLVDSAGVAPLYASVSTLLRGRQVVAVGDIQRAAEDSVLRALSDVMPRATLPSARAVIDPAAVRILQERGYAGNLQLIPTADMPRPQLVVVDGRGVPSPTSGMVEGPQAEVDATVDAIIDHILSYPQRSLAVVTISALHASRVREALNEVAAGSAAVKAFVSPENAEPFTIIDISQVAGIHRDAMILSVGLGKTTHGRVLHTFGALATPEGVGGLVDALQVARYHVTIVTSFGPGEMGAENLTAAGPKLLGELIDMAAGIAESSVPHEWLSDDVRTEGNTDTNSSRVDHVVSHDGAGHIETSPAGASSVDTGEGGMKLGGDADSVRILMDDLASRIEAAGFETAQQWGYQGGVRIPLVAGSRDFQGVWRVAVLVDNEGYMSEPSLRRRDRYWLEALEARGWIVMRTFVTALFIDPAGEAARIVAVLENLQKGIDVQPDGTVTRSGSSGEHEDYEELVKAAVSESAPVLSGSSGAGSGAAQGMRREERPLIAGGLPITAYTDDQLDELLEWIASDGVPRTEAELATQLREELNLYRRGAKVDAIVHNVIVRSGFAVDPDSSGIEGSRLGDAL
ncbi:MAG: hypothetical protein SPI12_02520 [Actinomycetaceae bacterium]|nr:hypothetical protein [Actinomycetaceae bacterium]MDY6082723.1 hypothetical protein [Actinomycetaceae bacterium]